MSVRSQFTPHWTVFGGLTSYLLAILVAPVELLGPRLALHHRVTGLQVGRVRHHSNLHLFVVQAVQSLHTHTQVILHVARALV